jgi:hypothetical protein
MRLIATLLLVIAVVAFHAGCAGTPQRLDLIALEGQPLSRTVVDQRECEAEYPYTREESTLQAYASCLLARGYISEVPLSASSGTKRITVYVRPDRGGRAPAEIRSDIAACEAEVRKAYTNAPAGDKAARWVVSYVTGFGPYGGGVNIQRGPLIETFSGCMASRGYTVGGEREKVVPGR